MKIVIDAMGGVREPLEIIRGALEAAEEDDVQVILTGPGDAILKCLDQLGYRDLPGNVEVANASEIITEEDAPALSARQKPDASMTVALRMLRDGGADALVSAGGAGALLAGATLILKRLKGVRRAALAPEVPCEGGTVLLVDPGTNVECLPEHLVQFARMGTVYARKAIREGMPRVGLLNSSAEPEAGTALQREAFRLMTEEAAAGRLRFVGNVTADRALMGDCDVLVSDGVSGGVLRDAVAGAFEVMLTRLRETLTESAAGRLAVRIAPKKFDALEEEFSEAGRGGSILLGVTKPVVRVGGAGDAAAVRRAVRQAALLVRSGVSGELAGVMGSEEET